MVVLIDPEWSPAREGDAPPPEAVLGGWRASADGDRFEPSPRYRPTRPDSPTDPADAVLRLVVRGDADGDRLLAVLDDVYLGVAVDEAGAAVIAPSPDEVPSMLVVTAPAHRVRVAAPSWLEMVTLRDLAGVLPDDGVDVLVNPGAPYSMRVLASAIKEFVARPEGAAVDGADVK
ncbi:hypothetical protein CLV71_12756 [Actinophytocola oryzae]|uniref:Type III secretion system (T3SS) SseB-like protein n=2 Tax=Actinophytocola oryzae TaxID=502181 RepID=A0A4R7US72_9PSEU|nr:hypothetical protein CLV71_12756 [Actinophytocola oryzae]